MGPLSQQGTLYELLVCLLQRAEGGLIEQPVESFSASAGCLFSPFVDFLAMLLVSTERWFFSEEPPGAVNSLLLGGRGVFIVFS